MTTKITLLSSFFSLILLPVAIPQGVLTPPGAPAPTMKTLDQVEARTPIVSAPLIIATSGSYYLTSNLAVATGNAITIGVDNVTLDLNGFTISSIANPAAGTAIVFGSGRKNICVKNGNIRGATTFSGSAFTAAGFLDGISNTSTSSANIRVSDLNIHGMGSDGINLGFSSVATFVVERCNVTICAGRGIFAGAVRDCTVDTAGNTGIHGDVVTNCSGETVNTALGAADGVLGDSNVENCRGISVSGNGVSGINVTNSRGSSTSGIGLTSINAFNCDGDSSSGSAGLQGIGTASFCRGKRNGGDAISAHNAIGCTVLGTGTVNATNKSLGTP
jgi:hypothetical protein